jgi:hypothetical protein
MLRARYRAFERASTRARVVVVVVVVVGSSLASRVARDDRTHRRVASSCDARGVVGNSPRARVQQMSIPGATNGARATPRDASLTRAWG